MRHVQRSRLVLCLGLSLSLGSACMAMDEDEIGSRDDEIVGGTNTTIAQHPWQIALTSNSGFQFCGGSILNASWVLTAQHCVTGGDADMRVVAGITRKSQQSTGQIRAIDGVATFPGFSDPAVGKDVALVHLASPLDLSGANARSIALVSPADASAGATNPGVISTITGWGTLSSGGSSPDILQTVDIPLISNTQAQAAYDQENITADQIGAALLGVGGKDSCQGDSGGPLTVQVGGVARLGGVVSWGYGCADAEFPGMYARVSSFQPWLSARSGGTFTPQIQLSNLSGARNSFNHRTVNVPAGALTLTAVVRGGSGDADLYVRRTSQPTTSQFNCRPFLGGNFEFCTVDLPAAGTWFVSLRGFAAYSGASLTAGVITP